MPTSLTPRGEPGPVFAHPPLRQPPKAAVCDSSVCATAGIPHGRMVIFGGGGGEVEESSNQ